MPIECPACGVAFVPSRPSARFCSRACAWSNPRLSRDYSTAEQFRARLTRNGDCLLYSGTLDEYGYGDLMWAGQRHMKAHRVAWLLAFGSLPAAPDCVLHRCDVRQCCNVAHLFIGSRPLNSRDMAEKDRGTEKVTNAQVLEIRRAYAAGEASAATLAARYGLSPGHVGDITRGRARRHVPMVVRRDGRTIKAQRMHRNVNVPASPGWMPAMTTTSAREG